ncbi:MAG: hypothetical protein CMJ24_01775 [Phycisphaerae bacterium]|nr:hypothetical protein [Phycisphaerae bacterium]
MTSCAFSSVRTVGVVLASRDSIDCPDWHPAPARNPQRIAHAIVVFINLAMEQVTPSTPNYAQIEGRGEQK